MGNSDGRAGAAEQPVRTGASTGAHRPSHDRPAMRTGRGTVAPQGHESIALSGRRGSSPRIAVGIPTFRRPEELERLLASLSPEIADRDVFVAVGDNDCGTAAPRVVAHFATQTGVPAVCVPVAARGVSEVRNVLVRLVREHVPDYDAFVMLDDDGYVRPGWFASLLDGLERYPWADVVAGPVLGELPAGSSVLARNSVFAGRVNHDDGEVAMLNGAQNVAVRRRTLDRLTDPWFDPALGRSGGEDLAFFADVVAAGGRLAWCKSAELVEPTPPERLTTKALLSRTLSNGVTHGRRERESPQPALTRARRWSRDAGLATLRVGNGVVRRDPDRVARAVFHLTHVTGRAIGLMGREAQELYGGD